MLKNANRLISIIVFVGLTFNTLFVHLLMHGAQPKGQELVVLKQQISRDIRSVKKTVSTLKILSIIIPGAIIGAGVVATIVAAAVVAVLTLAIKNRFKKTIKKLIDKKKNSSKQ